MDDFPELPKVRRIDTRPLDEARDSLARAREELGGNRDDLAESLAEMYREPRAELALTEAELRYLIDIIPEPALRTESESREAWMLMNKACQLLAVETQAGGKFVDPA
jgi:hypothetical protein